jgi:uncharacterized protein (DUF2249 family)
MSEPTKITLDVRPSLAAGQEPFPQIMGAAEQLKNPGDQFLLIAPFEPAPLYGVLGRQGFEHETRKLDDGSYEILFTHK